MKHIKKFNNLINEDAGQPKLSSDFKKQLDLVLDLVKNSPELSHIKDLASKVIVGMGDGHNRARTELANALRESFPTLDIFKSEFINTGTKIPFYGRTSKNIPNLLTGDPGDTVPENVNIFSYIVDELGFKPKY